MAPDSVLIHPLSILYGSWLNFDSSTVHTLWLLTRFRLIHCPYSTAPNQTGFSGQCRKGPLNPIWFDWECWEKRKNFIEAVKRGDAKHACRSLKKESDSCNRRMKRRRTRHLRNLFLNRLFCKDPAVHALLKKQTRANTTLVSAPVWHDHLHRHFRVARTFEELPRLQWIWLCRVARITLHLRSFSGGASSLGGLLIQMSLRFLIYLCWKV